jgi:DNA-binding NarL/FixJ family response regulator
MMKILLADDHVLFREGVRMVLEDLLQDPAEIFEAGDYGEVSAILAEHPDIGIAFLDLWMPGADGLAGVEALRRNFPDLPIVVVSAFEEPRDVRKVLGTGVRGFIGKSMPGQKVVEALAAVARGETFIAPPHAAEFHKAEVVGGLTGHRLTNRQREVLAMLQQGRSNKEIARDLGLAEITVKLHVTAILRAFGADNRTQVAIRASGKLN